jgi:hypothetical protein
MNRIALRRVTLWPAVCVPRPWRCFSSNPSAAPFSDYHKLILRKFIFQIHPDFFESYKHEQSINASNLQLLQSFEQTTGLTNNNNSSRGNIQMPRNLIFYIKPSQDDIHHFNRQQQLRKQQQKDAAATATSATTVTENGTDTARNAASSSQAQAAINIRSPCRKVKITMARMFDSMRDVLETIGTELPPKPTDTDTDHHHHNKGPGRTHDFRDKRHRASSSQYAYDFYVSGASTTAVGLEEFKLFLNSLIDRKELMAWRAERLHRLHTLSEMVVSALGVKAIEFRCGVASDILV